MKRLIIGNQAVAYAALEAGAAVAAGYPGTPSSEALTELLHFAQHHDPAPYVEWSVNEKVAFEVATAAAWTGQRAIATMKMSGANVAADSVLSVAYSGTKGGLVLYIADDPGAEAGMSEQDTRLFAQWAGLPLLEPATPQRLYELARWAFELSEASELPVILRSVTSVAHARQEVEGSFAYSPLGREAAFDKDILRYTKAGSAICLDQHRALLRRLETAEAAARRRRINRLETGSAELFVVAAGSLIPYVGEALAAGAGVASPGSGEPKVASPEVGRLLLESLYPLDSELVGRMLARARRILVLEELEPFVEMLIRSEASRAGWHGQILGKLDGLLPRVGKYSQEVIARGLAELAAGAGGKKASRGAPLRRSAAADATETGSGWAQPPPAAESSEDAAPPAGPAPAQAPPSGSPSAAPAASPTVRADPPAPSVRHPITFCAGCPHRGTFMAVNRALKKIGSDRDRTVVTGDIGCTILGMNPPFHTCWTEVSMGSSIGLAQGFVRAGLAAPVVATIGDSTFFHAGIPPLINAVQHGADIVVIILDNGWTSMTGFQVNPGTEERFQPPGSRQVEIEAVVRGLGVKEVTLMRPFDQESSVETLAGALQARGVRVIISQQECALPVGRREQKALVYRIDPQTCTYCRACLRETGCPALHVTAGDGDPKMAIDGELCTGCGLCATCCKFGAISAARVGDPS